MKNLLYKLLKSLNKIYIKMEYKRTREIKRDYVYERPLEYIFVLEMIMKHRCKKLLDVGSGRSAFPALLSNSGFEIVSVDEKETYWRNWESNIYYYVHQDDITNSKLPSHSVDAILCISTLEHIKFFNKAVGEMSRILKDNGILILTFPYTYDSYCENVYSLSQSDKLSSSFNYFSHSFSEENIENWKRDFDLFEIKRKYFKGWEGKYWRTGERFSFPRYIEEQELANGLCICLKKK